MSVAKDVTDLTRETPILKLNRLPGSTSARVLAKLGTHNNGGSDLQFEYTRGFWL